jgi:hypothetical protein
MAGLVPRLSGWVFVDKAHGIDSTRSQTFGQRSGREQEINAMRHEKIAFFTVSLSMFRGPSLTGSLASMGRMPWSAA